MEASLVVVGGGLVGESAYVNARSIPPVDAPVVTLVKEPVAFGIAGLVTNGFDIDIDDPGVNPIEFKVFSII